MAPYADGLILPSWCSHPEHLYAAPHPLCSGIPSSTVEKEVQPIARDWCGGKGPGSSHPIKTPEIKIPTVAGYRLVRSTHVAEDSNSPDAGWGGQCGIVFARGYGALNNEADGRDIGGERVWRDIPFSFVRSECVSSHPWARARGSHTNTSALAIATPPYTNYWL
jgi:hypothetical protein